MGKVIPFIKRMVAAGPGPKVPHFEAPKPQFGQMHMPPRPGAPKPMGAPKLSGAPMPPPPRPQQKKKSKFSELFK